MTVGALGTDATNSLAALAFSASMVPADFATLQQAIKDDQNVAHPTFPGAFTRQGLLFIPNRGVLKLMDGDWVGVDSQGWPILVSANSIANAAWTAA